MTVEQRILNFKMLMTRKLPFYGDVLLQIPISPQPGIGTACTDGRQIRYDPAFFRELPDGQLHYVILHEVLHVMLHHPTRRRNRDPKEWNIACDLMVNHILDSILSSQARELDIPLDAPPNALRTHFPTNSHTTETLYQELVSRRVAKIHGNSVTVPKALDPNDRWRRGETTVPIPGDLKGDSLSPEETGQIESAIREIVKQAAESSTSRGEDLSRQIPRELVVLTQSRTLDWRRLLRQHLEEEISDDSSYATPERKYLHMDLILPGHTTSRERLDEVWAFVDSSGSVGQKELSEFLTQLHRISRQFGCLVNIAYWDTSVTDVYRKLRTPDDILNAQPHHSGGTDINCVYDWMKANRVRPTVMIILTDGYFGTLSTDAFSPGLRRKTILVLSSKLEDQSFSRIGTVTRLDPSK